MIAIADATLRNVRDRLDSIERDPGVRAALRFLIALAHSAKGLGTHADLPDLSTGPSPIRLALALSQWVDEANGAEEYAELAKQASADTLVRWSDPDRSQADFFPQDLTLQERWGQAASGSGFSEVAREFFARFTERYLRYFLDRETSAVFASIADRETFREQFSQGIDRVSVHAFETSKITQSFAAGWYNKHARDAEPSDRQVGAFLRLAFQKIREELRREGGG